ncbi:MAG: hypothetical protein A3F42_07255 [Gammaproteobacteria bacterium RIFCSPHIGHO2_12_FULL_37_34]|nr:MAG: hypothetical protein A3F42_07255 [Gammaproteobacteria bacterium RIFCSPHIGHO2_12_FULL_37_34]
MLRQEINLYPQIKLIRTSVRWLSWKFLWLSNFIFICFFTLIYFSSLWNVHYLKAKVKQLTIQKNELQETFYKLKNTFPKMFFAQDMNQGITELKQEILIEKNFIKTIGNYTPFSEDLISLSNIVVPDVWLTDISIENGGETIVLKGMSTHSTNLRFFLDKISKDKIFKDYSLRANNIENDKKNNKENFTFTISMTKNLRDLTP